MPNPSLPSHRVTLTFSVEGLPARDDLLLKSLVRVLDHRARQQWLCVDRGADLRVSGAPCGASPADGRGGLVLRLGYPAGEGEAGLPMPLQPGQLEQMFNRLGEQLARQRAEAVVQAAQQPVRKDELFRLRRWPPAALVGTRERLSLATLMSARAQSLATLHRQSGASLGQCEAFVRELRQADLLQCSQAAPPVAARAPAAAPAQAPGLLARIRARFGLQPALAR